MTAAEITEGLGRLGVLHQTTLPYSPYQNAKQEAFWGPVEGRLIAMLEDVPDLALAALNEATQAWVEYEYNRKVHSEIGEAPITRFLAGPEVTRPSPDSDTLRLAFTHTDHRMQRKSDGTVVIEGRRFEIPNRYRHLSRIEVRYAGWDLGLVRLGAMGKAQRRFAEEQQRADVLKQRQEWFGAQLDLDPRRLVFIDETTALPQIWRAKAGVAGEGVGCASAFPTAITRPSRWSPVCVWPRGPEGFDKPMNAATFEEWVEKYLVPTLSKGDIVVMDNLSSHKGPRVEQLIEVAGAELRYLPP